MAFSDFFFSWFFPVSLCGFHYGRSPLRLVRSKTNRLNHDGRKLSGRDCFIELIVCDAKNSNAYYNLGATMTGSETVTLKDGRRQQRAEKFKAQNRRTLALDVTEVASSSARPAPAQGQKTSDGKTHDFFSSPLHLSFHFTSQL